MARGFPFRSPAAGVVSSASVDPRCAAAELRITVFDSSGHPVPGAIVTTRNGKQILTKTQTGPTGAATIETPQQPQFDLVAAKVGFEDAVVKSTDAKDPIRLVLEPAAAHESVEVKATASAVEAGASEPTHLPAAVVKELPSKPATVSDALPLVPGVIRKPDGAIELSASPEHRSALIVNSADVTDPATGQFGLTVPIDSVETVSVYQTLFLAEYGRFTAGLISVEIQARRRKIQVGTQRPVPRFRHPRVAWHLRGLRDATPPPQLQKDPSSPTASSSPKASSTRSARPRFTPCPFRSISASRPGVNSFTPRSIGSYRRRTSSPAPPTSLPKDSRLRHPRFLPIPFPPHPTPASAQLHRNHHRQVERRRRPARQHSRQPSSTRTPLGPRGAADLR